MRAIVRLSSALVHCKLAPLRLELLNALEAGGDIELDAAPVAELDAAGAQLLYVFCADAQRLGRRVVWRGAPEVLPHTAATLGMQALAQQTRP